MGNIGDSGYTLKMHKNYSGSHAYHEVYYLYPDCTTWAHSDRHGDLPRDFIGYFPFSWTKTGIIRDATDGKKTYVKDFKSGAHTYRVTITGTNAGVSWDYKIIDSDAVDTPIPEDDTYIPDNMPDYITSHKPNIIAILVVLVIIILLLRNI